MLDYLHDVEKRLPDLLHDITKWNTLLVLYERPIVERLWMQDGENRIYLHRIRPLNKELDEHAFLHRHPWPSAIKVLEGSYDMEFGIENNLTTRMVMSPGSEYEMLDPSFIHSVAPIIRPTLSLMVTGPRWTEDDMAFPPPQGPKHGENKHLHPEVAIEVFNAFSKYTFSRERF